MPSGFFAEALADGGVFIFFVAPLPAAGVTLPNGFFVEAAEPLADGGVFIFFTVTSNP